MRGCKVVDSYQEMLVTFIFLSRKLGRLIKMC